MKKLYPILLMLVVMLGSCSGDDSSNEAQNNNPDPVTPVVTDSTAIDSTATEIPLVKLSKIISTSEGSGYVITSLFTYDTDKLTTFKIIHSDPYTPDRTIEFIYIGNQLQNINHYSNEDLVYVENITYTGNNITKKESIDGSKTLFEYNSTNQLTGIKVIYNEFSSTYRTFNWDVNKNIVAETNYDSPNPGSAGTVANFEYDNKINPLSQYNKLLLYGSIDCYSKQNILKKLNSAGNVIQTYEYQYNENNYPVSRKTFNEESGGYVTTEYFYVNN